ncbi:MAG: hypothetical protein HFJ33_06110, partial [Clostridia bacterium]|nr:hypothetical protein [Clostridia bacterium]
PIIAKDTFIKAQEILKSKKSLSTPKHDELLKGLIFCHNCGRQLRICYRGKIKRIGYIDCNLARGKDKKCKTCNYNYNKFENKVLNNLKNIVNTFCNKNALKLIYEKNKDSYSILIKVEEDKSLNIKNKIEDVSKKLDKMYMDNLNGIIADDDYFRYSRDFIEQKEKLIKDKNDIQDKIKILQNKVQVNQDKEKADKVIKEFLEFEKPGKKILFELIDKIELDEFKNIYIYFNFSELNIVKEQ